MINRVYTLLSALLLTSFAVNCQKAIEYPVTTTQGKGLSADSLTAKYIFLFIGGKL
ncbi:MAG: hypothetical protein ACOCSE_01075 [Chitinivibrionales bacterium]